TLNEHCFRQPHWLLQARGLDTDAWYDRRPGKQQGLQNGGIASPQPDHLVPGDRYCRFADATTTLTNQLSSPWWISFNTFQIIRQFADRNGMNLSYAARLFLAVPEEWGRMDRVIAAVRVVPLDAYVGKGKGASSGKVANLETAVTSGGKVPEGQWTPVQHEPVMQMFIPGLRANRMPTRLASEAWKDVRIYFAHNMAAAR